MVKQSADDSKTQVLLADINRREQQLQQDRIQFDIQRATFDVKLQARSEELAIIDADRVEAKRLKEQADSVLRTAGWLPYNSFKHI